jgi:hypothetical protein
VFPQFNASIDLAAEEIIYKKYVNIGIAVDTDRGLLVPVVRDADTKNIIQIAVDIAQLSAKARDRKISLDEMQGGCFSISNLGGIGGTYFTPIVNARAGVLGISRGWAVWRARGQDGEFVPRLMLPCGCPTIIARSTVPTASAADGSSGAERRFLLAARMKEATGNTKTRKPFFSLLHSSDFVVIDQMTSPARSRRQRAGCLAGTDLDLSVALVDPKRTGASACISAASRRRRCCTLRPSSRLRHAKAWGVEFGGRSISRSCGSSRTTS